MSIKNGDINYEELGRLQREAKKYKEHQLELAYYYQVKGKPDLAEKEYLQLIEHKGAIGDLARLQLSQIYAYRTNIDKAMHMLQEISADSDYYAAAQWRLAKFYQNNQDQKNDVKAIIAYLLAGQVKNQGKWGNQEARDYLTALFSQPVDPKQSLSNSGASLHPILVKLLAAPSINLNIPNTGHPLEFYQVYQIAKAMFKEGLLDPLSYKDIMQELGQSHPVRNFGRDKARVDFRILEADLAIAATQGRRVSLQSALEKNQAVYSNLQDNGSTENKKFTATKKLRKKLDKAVNSRHRSRKNIRSFATYMDLTSTATADFSASTLGRLLGVGFAAAGFALGAFTLFIASVPLAVIGYKLGKFTGRSIGALIGGVAGLATYPIAALSDYTFNTIPADETPEELVQADARKLSSDLHKARGNKQSFAYGKIKNLLAMEPTVNDPKFEENIFNRDIIGSSQYKHMFMPPQPVMPVVKPTAPPMHPTQSFYPGKPPM